MSERTYLINPETGNRFLLGGCLRSTTPSQSPNFSAIRTLSTSDLPPSVDLRQLMTPVENQGQINSCVANAFAGAYEFLMMRNSRRYVDVSRLFVYYNSRINDGLTQYNMVDHGTSNISAVRSLIDYGCCEERLYPYNRIYVNQRPPTNCYTNAKNYLSKQEMQVNINLHDMKACLAQGYPFVFGIQLFQSFSQAETNGGRVPTPTPNEPGYSEPHSFHAMLCVGYSDRSQCFIVRNSWGPNWGDRGYCYLRYEYLANPQYVFDFYAIQIIGSETNQMGERTILNTYDWNVDKDHKWAVPHDYPYEDFHYKFFWNLRDKFDYFHEKLQHTHLIEALHKINLIRNVSKLKLLLNSSIILWIDRNSQNNFYLTEKLTRDHHVQIDFCPNLSCAQDYLNKYRDQIKSIETFQIVYQIYSKDEYENALNLVEFLNKNDFEHIQVIVYTQDVYEFSEKVEQQATKMKVKNWQQRLFFTNSSDELIGKSKQNREHAFHFITN